MSHEANARIRVIRLQRAYEDPADEDGYRVLVDRFWPRGRSKAVLRLDEWARDLAPEAPLIHWFGHAAERWDAFHERYLAELETPAMREQLAALLKRAGSGPITLVYGARSATENQAVVLREALLKMAG